MADGTEARTDLEEEGEVAAPPRGDVAAERGGVTGDPVAERDVGREGGRRGGVRAHPELGAWPSVSASVGRRGLAGEAGDEGVGAASAPLVVLHGAAQREEARERQRGHRRGLVVGGVGGRHAQAQPLQQQRCRGAQRGRRRRHSVLPRRGVRGGGGCVYDDVPEEEEEEEEEMWSGLGSGWVLCRRVGEEDGDGERRAAGEGRRLAGRLGHRGEERLAGYA